MILTAENVTKTYNQGKKVALKEFSLQMPKGCIYGLLGPNGAGKTSFIRIVNQILLPDGGKISFNGEPLAPEHISRIGYMPEERGLYKNMSVGDQIIYLAALKGMPAQTARKEAAMWFEKLGMEQWWDKKLAELSKGMAQKIQFVVTVIHKPELLILDEPFSGFDPVNANLIRDQILELNNAGTSIILSTHRMESVEELCDYVALIHQSRKIIDGKVYEVRQKFKNNSYRARITDANSEKMSLFLSRFPGSSLEQKEFYNELHIPYTGNQQMLLSEVAELGHVQLISENIPSMNDVFISAVNQTSEA